MNAEESLKAAQKVVEAYEQAIKSRDKEYAAELAELRREIQRLKTALQLINQEELNNQRPGGGYSKSARISYDALKGD